VTDSANVELVRSFGAAFQRSDFGAMAAWVDPEIEFVLADRPDPAPRLASRRSSRCWAST